MKRCLDVCVSGVLFVITLPCLLVIAVAIKLHDGGPVFYKGQRAGRNGRMFSILKFRTMVVDAERLGGPSTADDDARITRAGRVLRKYKLDELPQLVNVLKGDMSLVGPRPEVVQEVDRYTDEERLLLTVRPGITDYASLKFHDEGAILKGSGDPHEAYRRLIRSEKVRLGLEYVRNRSLKVDLAILAATVKTLATSRSHESRR